jgi:hypothetical protein
MGKDYSDDYTASKHSTDSNTDNAMVEDKEPMPKPKDKGKSKPDVRSLMTLKRGIPAKKGSLIYQVDQPKHKATNIGNTNRSDTFYVPHPI